MAQTLSEVPPDGRRAQCLIFTACIHSRPSISQYRLQVKTGYTDDTDFDPEKVKKGSVAAAGLCKWVHAMVVYNRIAKVVGPKRAALAEAETTLAKAMSELGEKQAMLKVTPQRQLLQIP